MESYSKSLMPGWRDGTVGYHIDHGKVFDGSPTGKETKGTITFVRITTDIYNCKGPVHLIWLALLTFECLKEVSKEG